MLHNLSSMNVCWRKLGDKQQYLMQLFSKTSYRSTATLNFVEVIMIFEITFK